MLVECSNCGAPLDVKDSARLIKCRYCDKTNRVRSLKTIAQKPPPTWKPPPIWTPPKNARASSEKKLEYRTRSRNKAGCVVPLIILGVLTAVAIPALVESGVLDRGMMPAFLGGWDGTTPFHCGGNDTVTISDITANLPGEVAITVNGNCQLTLENVNITAQRGIDADGNRSVTVRNSRIITTGTGIDAGGNRVVRVINSDVNAGGVGIVISGNASVTAVGGTVKGSPTAVRTGGNGSFEVDGTEVVHDTRPAPPPTTSRVATADPQKTGIEVEGPLAPEVIEQVLDRRRATLDRCIRQAEARHPNLEGILVVTFEVGRNGRVGAAEVTASTQEDAALERCLTRAIRRMRFPRPGGASARVTYRLPLVPQG